MDKVKVFEELLNKFETDEMREYCADTYVCRSNELCTWLRVCKG